MRRQCTAIKTQHGRAAARTMAILLVSTAALVSSPAFAQVAPTPANKADAQADNPETKDIIVTAVKREQALSKVAEGISVVTAKQLDERSATSLADYIALTPGVNIQTYGSTGWGWVEIRGISPQSVGATVSTYIDEVPVGATSALSRSGQYTPDIDPSDLARVEVLKGPQGTLYGASSLGGVIKYVTKGPSLTTTEIDTSEDFNMLNGGQFGTRLRASVSTPLITDTLGIRISGFYRHDAGWIDELGPVGRQNANSGNDYGFRGALRWKASPSVTVDLTASLDNYKANELDLVDLDPVTFQPQFGITDSHYNALKEDFRVRTDVFSGTVRWDTGYGLLTSATSYSYQKPGETSDLTGAFTGVLPSQPQDPTAVISYLHPAGETGEHLDKKTTEELRFNSRRLGPVEFTLGGFYQHEYLHDGADYWTYTPDGQQTNASVGTAWRTGTLNEYAGFLNATYYLTEKLDVTGGYRHSYINQSRDVLRGGYLFGATVDTTQKFNETADTYLAGLRWRPTSELMFYARAASGYRPGGGRTIPPGAPADFGSTYNSDSIWSYEAGMKFRTHDGKFALDADLFQIDWTDIQTLVAVGRFLTDGNGGKARSRGAEIQASFEPVRGLNIYANGALTDAKFTEDDATIGVTAGEHLYYVPKWSGTLGADYRWPLNSRWNGTFGGDYNYRSSQLDGTNFTLPAYGLLTLHAGAETTKYSINFYVKNALNKHVLIGDQGYYGDFPPFYATFTTPRQFGVTFNQKF